MQKTNLNEDSLSSKTIARLGRRRITWPTNAGSDGSRLHMVRYEHANDNNRYKILKWVDEHSVGEFYMAGSYIGFVDPRELTMFQLGWKA